VVDEQVAIVDTGNFASNQIASERNFVARDEDPADVASLVALFDADWGRAAPDLSCTRLVVSPVNSRARVLALISGAQTSLTVESMEFADSDVLVAVVERAAAGVDVRVLLADPGWISANANAAAGLQARGLAPRWLADPALHVKAIVADGARAYMGSENLSYTSLNSNREVGLIVTELDAVALMAATFETDWAAATPF
jgi:cardiolipin synthase